MNVIVCIKQVPATNEVTIDPTTKALRREGTESIINPYDMHALEQALQVKEKTGASVTVMTMGPPQAEEALRDAISMGADRAVLLSDMAFAGSDTLATSYALAMAITKLGNFDIIFCGKQTMDGDTGQVGPGLAEMLGIPCLTYVSKISKLTKKKVEVSRLTEEGYEKAGSGLPVLITVVKELNEPRLPGLKAMIRAKSAEIPVWSADEIDADETRLGLAGSPTKVVKIFIPKRVVESRMIEGKLDEQVTELADVLQSYYVE